MVNVYKATYSGVPVYEMNCKGIAVMRRKSDSCLNATQILKVADFDKPQRTRILEREVQTGEHEKVQGGYGKYQGTWVPFERGKSLAHQYGVDQLLAPILEYVQGDQSPPLAPKHVTAASARPRKSRETRTRKKPKIIEDVEIKHEQKEEEEEEEKLATEGDVEELDIEPMEYDKSYAQKLLDYFMSNKTAIPSILNNPPRDMDINVIIDQEGHTSLHWAAAMARIKIVKLLVEKGADIYRVNYKGQTALMRSVLFTNNFDLKTFDSLADVLRSTIFNIDKKDQTVFHHTAAMSDWKGKIYASRYYMECLISKFKNNQSELISILNVQDVNGDTALTIAAKIGNRRILKLLIDAGASADIVNEEGMAPRDYLTDVEKSMIHVVTPPTAVSSPPSESDTREVLKARIETMFKNVTNDPNNNQPISEVFDEFADSYERDLEQKEKLLDRKMIELDLCTKRLEETRHALDLYKDKSVVLEEARHQCDLLEEKYAKWLNYSQKQHLQILEERLYDDTTPLEETAEKLRDKLIQLEESRKQNIHKLIGLRCSIPPKKYQDYKRLISASCNVPYESVEMMLEPLLASFDSEASS